MIVGGQTVKKTIVGRREKIKSIGSLRGVSVFFPHLFFSFEPSRSTIHGEIRKSWLSPSSSAPRPPHFGRRTSVLIRGFFFFLSVVARHFPIWQSSRGGEMTRDYHIHVIYICVYKYRVIRFIFLNLSAFRLHLVYFERSEVIEYRLERHIDRGLSFKRANHALAVIENDQRPVYR